MAKRSTTAVRDFLITVALFSCSLGIYGAWSGIDAPKASKPKGNAENFVYRSRNEVIARYAIGGVIAGAVVGSLAGAAIVTRSY
jgi:hypothetical protein